MFEKLKRLFPGHKEGSNKTDQPTLPINRKKSPVDLKPLSKTKYKTASCQSPGKERSHNEDTLFTLTSLLDGIDSAVSLGIFLVADGMGGHQGGEIASVLAARAASQYLLDRLFGAFLFEQQHISDSDLKKFAKEAVDKAQSLLLQRVPGGGTTLTLVMAVGDRLISAHVGDSRLYVINQDGDLVLRTKDHSLVKRLVDLGEISEDEASVHPQRNVLYRALGQTDPFEADIDKFSIQPGERMMICSDGLWGVLDHEEMMQIIEQSNDIDQAACDLVQAANDSGGPDNISVVLVERLS